jgi:hypothetical protein
MMLRKLVLYTLLISAFGQNAGLSPSASHAFYQPTDRRLAHASAQTRAPETSGFDSAYQLSFSKPVQDKNFFLLSLFQRNRDVRRLLIRNLTLKRLAADKLSALKKGANCSNAGCFDQLIRLDGPTIEAVANQLETLANRPEFKLLAKKDLRPSGVFIKYADQSDAQMFVAAWKDAASGLNRILSVYGLGKDPRYKDIDRVSFDVNTEDYRNRLKTRILKIKLSQDSLFFELTLDTALALLEINRRDEAGRFEPLEQGENKAAFENLSKIKWKDYPYSFILVLGSGGRDLTTRISPIGAQRTDVAAQLFLQHKAPLIMVSGGYVHPMQTPFCEAIEMKRYLMEKYQIPETSILIDPHARHTTTNFRNGARLAFRYRIPADRTALVTSSEDHITFSISDDFRTRCMNELGYFPVEFIRRVSPVAAEFKPSVLSLFFDANDPLDP